MLMPTCGSFAKQIIRPIYFGNSPFAVAEPYDSLSCPNHCVIAARRNIKGLQQLMSLGHVERDAD